MMYTALKILEDKMLAEDAVQDAFIKLTNYLDKIEDIYSERTKEFIVIVIKSVAIDNIRKRKRKPVIYLEDMEDIPDVSKDELENINSEDILNKLKSLPEIYRDVLEMKIYYGFTAKQISQILCIPYSKARKRLELGRKYFAKLLNEEN